MTLSNETIELIEKKIIDFYGDNQYSFGGQRDGARWAAQNLLTDPAILASVKGDEWVNVNDKLPDFNKEVLLAIKYQDQPILAYYAKSGKWYGSRETRDWMIDGFVNDAELIVCEITHWQPLPTPPKTK